MSRVTLTVLDRVIEVEAGHRLSDLCEDYALAIPVSCRAGACGRCKVTVVNGSAGLSAVSKSEARFQSKNISARPYRLACQCKVIGDVEVAPFL